MKVWMASLLIGVSSLLAPVAQGATPPAAIDSVEWSCASAAYVVVGRITEVIDSSGGGKSRGLRSLLVRGEDLRAPGGVGVFPVSMRSVSTASLEAWRKDKSLLVFFLRETAQGYSLRGRTWHLWPTRDRSGTQRVVSLQKPGRGRRKLQPLRACGHLRCGPEFEARYRAMAQSSSSSCSSCSPQARCARARGRSPAAGGSS